jgi:hypothetical protein
MGAYLDSWATTLTFGADFLIALGGLFERPRGFKQRMICSLIKLSSLDIGISTLLP